MKVESFIVNHYVERPYINEQGCTADRSSKQPKLNMRV